jgi:hypothetical protein
VVIRDLRVVKRGELSMRRTRRTPEVGRDGANVIHGKSCCGRYIKDSEEIGAFDEWLIEIETMNEAIATLKNFDEEAGEVT